MERKKLKIVRTILIGVWFGCWLLLLVNSKTDYIGWDAGSVAYQVLFVILIAALIATVPVVIVLYVTDIEKIAREDEITGVRTEENEIDKLINEVKYEK